MDIHNFEKMYCRAVKSLEQDKISERNKQLIKEFVEAMILENISKPRLIRCMGTLRKVAKELQKDLDQATIKDIKSLVSSIQQSKYSPWTKRTYKCLVRKFYKWQKGVKGRNKYPEIVDWINIGISRSEKKLPSEGDLLTEEDVQKLIENADYPRDKAFLSMLWESGARIGEIGNLSMKNIVFDQQGVVISVRGKTGSRKIRLISSTPHLSTWINNHPAKGNNDAPVWVNIGTVNHNKLMTYAAMRMLLYKLFRRQELKKDLILTCLGIPELLLWLTT